MRPGGRCSCRFQNTTDEITSNYMHSTAVLWKTVYCTAKTGLDRICWQKALRGSKFFAVGGVILFWELFLLAAPCFVFLELATRSAVKTRDAALRPEELNVIQYNDNVIACCAQYEKIATLAAPSIKNSLRSLRRQPESPHPPPGKKLAPPE